MRPGHHDLCFGCGQTNLFGLLLEVEETAPGVLRGRCFVKQDHQGADRGTAHEGVIAAALSEAMALATGPRSRASSIQVEFLASVPVGAFVEVEAQAREDHASATANVDGARVARATGTYHR